ncbi:hypothetical protein [Curtobacterium sp. MCBA15_001]|uniref:hypothetical protein n=1 Tax=Curtobacterium sp. MCBA15_001 TaxID=1898731 RepID=UPI0008DD318A|nr:hypothetical protein [Curtobacterium sp. MCBA15_001]OIH97908.1 hypothetical protein BIU90_12875 [Curtobacterium sp. MCBA15_001]
MITLSTSPLVIYGLPTLLVLAAVIAVFVTIIFHLMRDRPADRNQFGQTLEQQQEHAAGQVLLNK